MPFDSPPNMRVTIAARQKHGLQVISDARATQVNPLMIWGGEKGGYSLDAARTALHAGFAITCCTVGACARRACHCHLPHVLRAALCVDLYHQPVSLCYNRFLQHSKQPLRRGSVRGCGRCGSVLLRGDDAPIMHAVLHCCYIRPCSWCHCRMMSLQARTSSLQ